MRPRRPEPLPDLVAPGGSKEAWAAAVEGGADAVYVGLKHFSARAGAENFSRAELAAVIRESRRAGVKIYLAFNALIKEGELAAAWKALAEAAELAPDALILQDWGLARLAAAHFPHLPRHASTLTAVHSLPGLNALKEAGFSQAVLPRELAFDEAAALCAHSPIGLSVFIHGALCFSFSGLCLMSSFLGGRSALRGSCAQPCRRAYRRGGRRGTFFSAADLSLAPHFLDLRRLPLAGLKIEGRMKGPDYVGRATRAYRLLLDAPEEAWPEALAEAEALLAEVPGRPTCGGPWAARSEGPLAPLARETVSGLKLGFLEPAGPHRGAIELQKPVARLDRLRLQAQTGEESVAFNLKTLWLEGAEAENAPAGSRAVLESPGLPEGGRGWLFKIASGREERLWSASPLLKALAARGEEPPPRRPFPPLPGHKPVRPAGPGKNSFWLWLERAEDLPTGFEPAKIILPLSPANVLRVKRRRRRLKGLVWSLPPLMFHRRQSQAARELEELLAAGFQEFLASNIGHINILKRAGKGRKLSVWGDHRLGVLNGEAEAFLAEQGFCGVTLSLEMDGATAEVLWRRPAAGGRLIYLYGRPALFTSRFPLEGREALISPRGEKFHLGREGEAVIVTADRPVFLAPVLKKPPLPGGAGFILDLRREPQLEARLRSLKKALNAGSAGLGSAFNLARTLT